LRNQYGTIHRSQLFGSINQFYKTGVGGGVLMRPPPGSRVEAAENLGGKVNILNKKLIFLLSTDFFLITASNMDFDFI
jgi:hypothetical protein